MYTPSSTYIHTGTHVHTDRYRKRRKKITCGDLGRSVNCIVPRVCGLFVCLSVSASFFGFSATWTYCSVSCVTQLVVITIMCFIYSMFGQFFFDKTMRMSLSLVVCNNFNWKLGNCFKINELFEKLFAMIIKWDNWLSARYKATIIYLFTSNSISFDCFPIFDSNQYFITGHLNSIWISMHSLLCILSVAYGQIIAHLT